MNYRMLNLWSRLLFWSGLPRLELWPLSEEDGCLEKGQREAERERSLKRRITEGGGRERKEWKGECGIRRDLSLWECGGGRKRMPAIVQLHALEGLKFSETEKCMFSRSWMFLLQIITCSWKHISWKQQSLGSSIQCTHLFLVPSVDRKNKKGRIVKRGEASQGGG